MASSRPTATATTSWFMPTNRGAKLRGFPRSGSSGNATARPPSALADYLAPRDTGIADYLGAFAVTAGIGLESLVEQFERDHDDYNAIMSEALADRLAEARRDASQEGPRRVGLRPRGTVDPRRADSGKIPRNPPCRRLSQCPDHTDKDALWRLLDVEKAAGIVLTESYAMYPGASVSGFYFANPQARYFAVDFLTRDQIEKRGPQRHAGQRGQARLAPTWPMIRAEASKRHLPSGELAAPAQSEQFHW